MKTRLLSVLLVLTLFSTFFSGMVLASDGDGDISSDYAPVCHDCPGETSELMEYIPKKGSSEDYRAWTQGDSRWGSIPMGSSGSTVSQIGCTVTSVTKLIIQCGLRNADSFNVGTLVNWLNSNSGFTSDGSLYWGKPSEYISGFSNYGNLLSYGTYSSSGYNDQILSWIKAGYHMTISVNGGGHWVAVDEAKSLSTGKIYIMDSLSGYTNADITLASRYSTFTQIHAYTGGTTPEAITYYTLTFDANGGSVSPSSMIVAHGCKPTSLPMPTMDGNTFLGWFTERIGGTEVTTDTAILKDMTLYARWRIISYPVEGGNFYFDRVTGEIIDCDSNVTNAIIPEKIEGVPVVVIGKTAFWGCELRSVTIPCTVNTIGNEAFGNCKNLSSITIPEGVSSIGDSAFYNCNSLVSVYLPASLETIGTGVFRGAIALPAITVDAGSDSFTSIEGVLFDKNVTNLYQYPNGKNTSEYHIPGTVVQISNSAFRESENLTSVYVPAQVSRIDSYAFLNCNKLESAYFLGDAPTDIGSEMFKGTADGFSIYYLAEKVGWSSPYWNSYPATTWIQTHQHQYTDEVTPPTCTAQGYTTYTCSDCGDSYKDTYTAALGHSESAWIVDCNATCTASGSKHTECTRCGVVMQTATIAANGHTAGAWIIDKNATCTASGTKHTECMVCGATLETTTIPATGHSYTSSMTAPTCTEKGYTTHTCACGDSYVDSYVAALGHAWDGGKVTTQPTATESGVKTFTCTRCNATRTESIPATGEQNDKSCDGGADCPSGKFVDVNPKEWYHPYVDYAVTHGLFGGTSENTFEPETAMTRAMLVTVLWRYEGKPMGYLNTFSDVNAKDGSWYMDAVAWAAANGVVNGVGNGRFDPDGKITREQMATILFRYAQKKGIDTSKRGNLGGFPDANRVSSYAKDAVQWAVGEGIINGSDGKLLPQGSATRAQVATILMRYIENTVKK